LPCVVVSNASGAQQQIRWTRVAQLAHEERLPAPALMIVGRVASRKIQEITEAFLNRDAKDRRALPAAVS